MDSRDSSTNSFEWTGEQLAIIQSPPESRILVDAGPGTGKTATACARIAWLIDSGRIEPSEIWLFSFTRTAVHELRTRIASYLSKPGDVAALRIATIDSQAWAIHSGFDETASLTGSFDENIQHVIELVRSHAGVFEYLNSIRHLIVDEAQDVVGMRCELLLEIINVLPKAAGVSIFSDEAQSIYGFAEDSTQGSIDGALPEKIGEFMPDFHFMELNEVHRTDDMTLLSLFSNGRKFLRDKGAGGAKKIEYVSALIKSVNHQSLGLYRDDIQDLPEDLSDAFLLFRRRGEVLDASSYLGTRPHRLRMSGLPTCIHGWIAVIFWDWTASEMDQQNFEHLWKQRLGPPRQTGADRAWASLNSTFAVGRSATRISVTKMVTRLASASPSYELTTPEFGSQGPIIGTIHGSKGREAAEVRLYIPPPPGNHAEQDQLVEEARILFVGATRAKSRLSVGQAAPRAIPRRLDPSGRAFTPYPYYQGRSAARATVEIGRARDIDAPGLVGKSFYASQNDALLAQHRVMELKSNMGKAHAIRTNGNAMEWRYGVMKESGELLCYLSTAINVDLFGIAKAVDQIVHLGKGTPPKQLKHLKNFGVRTMALAPDDENRERLHAPWRDSGVIAAPLISGYPLAFFY